MDTMTAGFALVRANIDAQRAFRDMLIAGVYGDPTATLTRAYVAAERRVDELLRDAQGRSLALGDHHVGVGR